mgnify:CR=1 FL=1
MANVTNFEKWKNSLVKGIATYDFYVDFDQIKNEKINSSNPYLPKKWKYIKDGLALLSSDFINAKNIRSEFVRLLNKYPKEILYTLPLLVAKKDEELFCTNKEKGDKIYTFEVD